MRFPNIPPSLDLQLQRYLRDLSNMLQDELNARVPNTQEVAELILVSPSRKVYSVGVDDNGDLTVTLVRE